jgi:hypothetical protein
MCVNLHTSLRGGALEHSAHQACEKGALQGWGHTKDRGRVQKRVGGTFIHCKDIYFNQGLKQRANNK